jgi:signal recognition particle GTPase
MGDVVSLVERAAALRNADEMETIGRRMLQNEFDFNDFLKQADMVAAMGNMASMARMIPGVAGRVSDAQMAAAEQKMRSAKSLIQSMTPAERRTPEARAMRCRARADTCPLARVCRAYGGACADAGDTRCDACVRVCDSW